MDKLQRARNGVKTGLLTTPVLSVASPFKLFVGNWSLEVPKPGELHIKNIEGPQQNVILRDELAGFLFESNRGTRHSFTAESALGPEFASVGPKRFRRLKSKLESQKVKVRSTAKDLYERYFQEAKDAPRSIVLQLRETVSRFTSIINQLDSRKDSMADVYPEFRLFLESCKSVLKDEHTLSPYELYSSGLIPVFLNISRLMDGDAEMALLFKRCFCCCSEEFPLVSPVVMFVRKLLAVLETVEKLPQCFYDAAGSAFGLQLLIRRLRLKLEKAPTENSLIDRSGRSLKVLYVID